MAYCIVLSLTVAILIVGRLSLTRQIRRGEGDLASARTFVTTLHRYWESKGADGSAYAELVRESPHVQRVLGGYAVTSRPFRADGVLVRNYPVILNGVPEVQRFIADGWLFQNNPAADVMQSMQEAVMRYDGDAVRLLKTLDGERRNILSLLREGVSAIAAVPINVLHSLGVLSDSASTSARQSRAFRLLRGLLALLYIASAIVTLVTGSTEAWSRLLRWQRPTTVPQSSSDP